MMVTRFDNFQKVVKSYQTDIMVYKLYELTYDEVLVIDAGFGMSEQEYDAFTV